MLLVYKDGNKQPMVDKRGRFFVLEEIDPEFVKNHVNTELYSEYAGRFVKNAYDPQLTEEDATLDIDLSVMLKKENKAFEHPPKTGEQSIQGRETRTQLSALLAYR